MRVLVLGARAPACMEWLRKLRGAGHCAWAADSMTFPLSRFSKACSGYLKLPRPKTQFTRWHQCLRKAVKSHQIDLIIPTCEEVFYLAKAHDLQSLGCDILCSNFKTLAGLHNKYQFSRLVDSFNVTCPKTVMIESKQSISPHLLESKSYVAKPVFSRFASKTLIKPSAEQLNRIEPSVDSPWVLQEFISGVEYCSYAVVSNGVLLANVCYRPKYRAGLGAGIYFERVEILEIDAFVAQISKSLNFTGQISFDYIRTPEGRIYVIECNPRATSGIHFIKSVWVNGKNSLSMTIDSSRSSGCHPEKRMVFLALMVFHFKKMFDKRFREDVKLATDVIWDKHDVYPLLLQPLVLIEVFYCSIRFFKSPIGATTFDIEWDGHDIG